MSFWQYVVENKGQILNLLIEHINLTAIAVALAILIGVPLGIFISYASKASKIVLSLANVIQAIPSMALLGFMIPFFGVGELPAIVAVVMYSLLPIVKNTFTGIHNINAQTLEAAKGIGLTPFQVLFRVQIPLALPIIMTGVRVTSVTAVGLMTIASFIGAGGLGYLVFSGINTVSTNQILAGAIPACLLALSIDFTLGLLEKLVTPISLQKGDKEENRRRRRGQKAIFSAIMVVVAGLISITLFSAITQRETKTITIASKEYSEQKIISHMMAELIEDKTDIKVNRKMGLQGTKVSFDALRYNNIDMYVEYTGTAYINILNNPPKIGISRKEIYDSIKSQLKSEYNIEVLKEMNFNNSYGIAVKKEVVDKYNLKTISDFAKVADKMHIGMGIDFVDREDGLKGLLNIYDFQPKETSTYAGSLKYTALMSDEVDAIVAYTTDGLLKKFDLVVLEDDKNLFAPYYAVPIITEELNNKYPELASILDEVGSKLSNEIMIELNYKVDEEDQSPRSVAANFLRENGFIE